jgi:glycerol uptake facilitator-like aquaporin
LAGGVLAGFALRVIFSPNVWAASNLGTPGLSQGVSFLNGVYVEAILTFLLVFTIFGTAVDSRAPKNIYGFAIGLVLTFDILMGGPLTGASMNPARTFGPGLAAGFFDNHLVYWIGPILGGIAAALLYNNVLLSNEDGN